MITRVTVKSPDPPPVLLACKLGGMGIVICGNCDQVLKSIAIGARCTGCGAAVVDVQRVGDRFEGERW